MKHTLASPSRVKTDIRPTSRELRWFAHIDRHGPQSSEFLYECTRDTHRCRDTSLRRMHALREAGYLRLPAQQRQIAKADFNPYVYDLTKLGWDLLADHKDLEKHCRPTGHWWHGYWVSSVSSAFEICAYRAGISYIPAVQILEIRGVEIGIPVSGTKLIPDQLFALKHIDGYRAFALEVDRGTEPIRSAAARKSLQKSVMQYREVLARKLHQKHFGMKSNLFSVWLFGSHRRNLQFRDVVGSQQPQIKSAICEMIFPKFNELSESVSKLGVRD